MAGIYDLTNVFVSESYTRLVQKVGSDYYTGDGAGPISFSGASFQGLPTSEPNITGALWVSGSSEAHPNSGYLMVFNP